MRKVVWVKNPLHWQRISLHKSKNNNKNGFYLSKKRASKRARTLFIFFLFYYFCLFVCWFVVEKQVRFKDRRIRHVWRKTFSLTLWYFFLFIYNSAVILWQGFCCISYFCLPPLLFKLLRLYTLSGWLHSIFFLCEIFSMNFAFCWTSCVDCESSER